MNDDWAPMYTPETDHEYYSDYRPSDTARAFAAYEAAWRIRSETGDTADAVLVQELVARKVPRRAFADHTMLGHVLFSAWQAGRPTNRLHGVILRYRLRRTGQVLLRPFRDPTPATLRPPSDVRSSRRWRQPKPKSHPFRPAGSFTTRAPHWYHQVSDHRRTRSIPVWLDVDDRATQTRVMVADEVAGHTTISDATHAQLVQARDRGRRVAPRGHLVVTLKKNGQISARELVVRAA